MRETSPQLPPGTIAMEWRHACYVPQLPDGTDAVIVKVARHKENGDVVPALKIEKGASLVRPFFITKPNCQNHKYKKEWEYLKYLDRYDVQNHLLEESVARALNGGSYGRSRRQRLNESFASPFIYGADQHIECILKKKYQTEFAHSKQRVTKITTGFFDIETNMFTDDHEPIVITVTHEHKVYTAILERFFIVENKQDGSYRRGDLEEFKQFSKQTLDYHIDELLNDHLKKNKRSGLKKRIEKTPFEYHYYIGKTPLDCIKWIFSQIHQNKTDFLGIWNLDFDIPKVMNEIKSSGARLEDIFCPPELPKDYRYVKYVVDESDSSDIYKKWHWLHTASYTQFIDSMCLYRILRTVKGMEIEMSLDAVLKENDLGGKLTFKDDNPDLKDLAAADYHRYMQKHEPYKYIIYNQFDCISMQLMEWKNDDISSMNILGGVSRLCKWTKQTRKVSDAFYFDALEDGRSTASPASKEVMETEFDKMIPKVGGAVLRPERTSGIGLKIFSDQPEIETFMHSFVSDVDFSGHYPSINCVANVSKETKISASLTIENFSQVATQNFYSLMVSLHENAVMIGSKYFGLKDYIQMDDAFAEYLKHKDTVPF